MLDFASNSVYNIPQTTPIRGGERKEREMKYEIVVYDTASRYITDVKTPCITFEGLDARDANEIMGMCMRQGKHFVVSCLNESAVCGEDACDI